MGPDSSGEHRPHQLREKLGQLDVGVAGAGFTRQFMDAKTLPLVKMPNRDGFVPDPRPDVGPTARGKSRGGR